MIMELIPAISIFVKISLRTLPARVDYLEFSQAFFPVPRFSEENPQLISVESSFIDPDTHFHSKYHTSYSKGYSFYPQSQLSAARL